MTSWASYLANGVPPKPQPITCKAAVIWKAGDPFKVETITVAPPKAGEVCGSFALVAIGS